MILVFLAAAASTPVISPAPIVSPAEERFKACIALVDSDPAKAADSASEWRVKGGGLPARHCLGLAFAAQRKWVSAMTAFEQAAQDAEGQRDARAAAFWVQAGNAALAAGELTRARSAFDSAIAKNILAGPELGEAHLDRARVLAAQRDNKSARADIDAALKLVPEDPLAWLLSATLARRAGDLARAAADIAEAGKRSPDDASVALEAGNIAVMSGADEAARTAWEAAVRVAPDSEAGKAAAENLKQLPTKAQTPPPATK